MFRFQCSPLLSAPYKGDLILVKSLIFGKNNIVSRSFDDVTFLAGIF